MNTELVADGWPRRVVRALPDLLTAGIFLWVWFDPSGWRRPFVTQGLLVMLLEFILIHSGGMLLPVVLADDQPRARRLRLVAGMSVFYALFVGVWAWQFKSWWALALFFWLLGAKWVAIAFGRRILAQMKWQQQGMMGASALFYLLAVPACLFLPLPRLGLTHGGGYYGVPGSGAWVSQPHTYIAALVIYFSLLALTKLLAWDLAFARNARAQD